MWTTKSKIFFILYKLTAACLPISQRLPLAKKIRSFWARRIATCGKDVNIERNAYFTPGLSLGDYSGVGIRKFISKPLWISLRVFPKVNETSFE